MDYTKVESSTWLKINVDIVIRQYSSHIDVPMCSTWFIKVNQDSI